MTAAPFPVRLEGRMDSHLSRWLWLVKWLLVIPHLVVLAFLWAGFAVLSVVAFVAVAVRGTYPRRIFDFNLGVLRWTWRVVFYAYGALGTDRYPPFTLADVPDHPARLEIPYPEHLPHGFALLRWWIIALPHYVLAIAIVGSGWLLAPHVGVLTLLVLMGGVALAFTGRYPRALFDLVVGLNRWVVRAAAYASLMTDVYPPLRFETGEETVTVASRTAPHRVGSRPALVATGAVVAFLGLSLMAGGAALLALDAGRGADGFVDTHPATYSTSTYALTLSPRQFSTVAGITPADVLGTVRIVSRSGRPVFLGIGRADDVERYLGGVRHVTIDDLAATAPRTTVEPGAAPANAPADTPLWVASTTGSGRHQLRWTPRTGSWTAVVMNADGSRDVRVVLRAGARLPHLGAIGAGVLGGGVLVASLAAGLLLAGLGRRGDRE